MLKIGRITIFKNIFLESDKNRMIIFLPSIYAEFLKVVNSKNLKI